jgi:hypothetical protein
LRSDWQRGTRTDSRKDSAKEILMEKVKVIDSEIGLGFQTDSMKGSKMETRWDWLTDFPMRIKKGFWKDLTMDSEMAKLMEIQMGFRKEKGLPIKTDSRLATSREMLTEKAKDSLMGLMTERLQR